MDDFRQVAGLDQLTGDDSATLVRTAAEAIRGWAGHSAEVLPRTYARCLDGQHDIAKRRIMEALDDPARDDSKPPGGAQATAISEPATAQLPARARKLDAKMALMAGSFSQRTTGRESPHVFSTDSRGRPVFARANRTPPGSAVPNAALSGSGETAG